MTRCRYWNLTIEDLQKSSYNENKVLVWEIKCTKRETEFFGIFCYRNGTPFDYETVKGIVYYYNNIPRNDLTKITKFLKDRFGGNIREKGERIFLEGSQEIYSAKDIAAFATELEKKFEVSVDLSVEFQDFTPEEQEKSELPKAKNLPIPGK